MKARLELSPSSECRGQDAAEVLRRTLERACEERLAALKLRTMTDGPGTVGASLRGHAYHHAWAARSALALLEPATDLEFVVVENFSIEDAPDVSAQAMEVADLVRYFGSRSADDARQIEVVQFKHSDARANGAFRAADAAKTIKKFAAAFRDFEKTLGAERRNEILRFNLTTNRPIHADLAAAVEALAEGRKGEDGVADQMEALRKAAGLRANRVAPFLLCCPCRGDKAIFV